MVSEGSDSHGEYPDAAQKTSLIARRGESLEISGVRIASVVPSAVWPLPVGASVRIFRAA
jgi:hypothetical protein